MIPPLISYRHPGTGFTVPLPEEWERAEDANGVALIAVEPGRGPWFRANAVVTVDQLDPALNLPAWQDGGLALMREALPEFQLIDVEETELGGRPARRTLAHHRADGEQTVDAVTLEQWSVVEGRFGYTLSTSVATLEYGDMADLFAELARRFRPDPELAP